MGLVKYEEELLTPEELLEMAGDGAGTDGVLVVSEDDVAAVMSNEP